MIRIGRLALMTALLFTPACSATRGAAEAPERGGSVSVPSGAPDAVGPITRVWDTGDRRYLAVQLDRSTIAGARDGIITILPETRLLITSGGGVRRARGNELVAARRVQVWFSGAPRNVSPLEANADVVLIEPR